MNCTYIALPFYVILTKMKLIQTQTVPLQFKLTFSIFTIIPGITQGRSSLFQPIHNTLYIQEDAVS